MYCPKCGAVMVGRHNSRVDADVFYCATGDMECSLHLTRRLMERYGAIKISLSLPRQHPGLKRHALQWYCPACGVGLNDQLECEACGKLPRDLIYQLIELHPHLGDGTR